jgi:uncharacterized membrane protein
VPDPSLTTTYILAVITSVVSLFLTQGLIDNSIAKFVTGLASIIVPLVLAAVHANVKAKVHAARIASRAPAGPVAPVK